MLFASSSALNVLLANPTLSSVILPLHLLKNNMAACSILLAVSDIIIPVLSISRFLPVEGGLLNWMNECTTEWWKYTRGACTTIDWRQFAKVFVFVVLCKYEVNFLTGFHLAIPLPSPFSLSSPLPNFPVLFSLFFPLFSPFLDTVLLSTPPPPFSLHPLRTTGTKHQNNF